MTATWKQQQEKGPEFQPQPVEEVKTVESPKKALRRCSICGKEFEGDPKTSLPVCPECRELGLPPRHPEGVPL